MNVSGWGIPDLQGQEFKYWNFPNRLMTVLDHIVVFENDWKEVNFHLTTEEMLDICHKIMVWFNLSYLCFYANRQRMSNLSANIWMKHKIDLKLQLTGWADVYWMKK